jgi:hypothetical protein
MRYEECSVAKRCLAAFRLGNRDWIETPRISSMERGTDCPCELGMCGGKAALNPARQGISAFLRC